MTGKSDKIFRMIKLSDQLSRGGIVRKNDVIAKFGITPKTFQRDIGSLRYYYNLCGIGELVYDKKNDYYRLESSADNLSKEEVFAVCKVLIESRAFNKDEFEKIICKLLKQFDEGEAKTIKKIIANERINYLALQHGKPLTDMLWQLAMAKTEQRIISITYRRGDKTIRSHEVKPVGIMFSEFYFYLIAYLADDSKKNPTTFRVDRINEIKITERTFSVPYLDKFSESEFRNRVLFMYSGELRIVRFIYKGNLEAVFDRLPTARIERETDEGPIIRAEAYGEGVDMWLRSQGDKVIPID